MTEARAYLAKMMANCTVPEVSIAINCRADQLYSWLRGKHKIYTKHARSLARYFNVGPENFLDEWYELDPADTSFGTELRRERLRMGMSLREMAYRIGYADKTICNWEHNQIKEKKQEYVWTLVQLVKKDLPEVF